MPCSAADRAIAPGASCSCGGGVVAASTPSWNSRARPRSTPTTRPKGPFTSVGPGWPRVGRRMKNRKRTMMAPAYTSTCNPAKNCASSRTNSAASANSVTTNHSALATGLARVMQSPALAIASPANAQKMIRPAAIPALLLARGVGRIPQRRDGVGLRAQPLEVVHEPVARELGVLVVHADVDGLLRAHFLAVAAEDAAELVDFVDQRVPVPLLILPGDELDAVGRADLRTQPARHAFGPSLLVGQHAVRAAPARRQRPVLGALLLGVLHRHLGPEQAAEREQHALQRGAHVRRPRPGPLHHLHGGGHQASALRSAPEPARMCPRSTTKNSRIASTTLTPNKASAKRVSYVQPSCSCKYHTAVAVTVRYPSARGSITFQPRAMS